MKTTRTPETPDYATIFTERIRFAALIGWEPENVKNFAVYPSHILVTDMQDVPWILRTANMKTKGWTRL